MIKLEEVSKIFEKTKIRPSIDRIYTLDEINDALKKVTTGSSRGKTIIKIYDSSCISYWWK